MNDVTTIMLQILSILVSGGLLQFITFVIKRSDSIRKLSRTENVKVETSLLFASEKELLKKITALESKLKTCHRNLAAARRHDS